MIRIDDVINMEKEVSEKLNRILAEFSDMKLGVAAGFICTVIDSICADTVVDPIFFAKFIYSQVREINEDFGPIDEADYGGLLQ